MGITQQIGASSIIKPGVCTSTTRPASPYEGQAIYETDTDKVLVYNGTAWVIPNSPAQNPTGLEYVTSTTVGTGVSSVTVSNCFSTTYDDYFVTIDGIFGTAGAAMNFRCVTSGGADNGSNWKGNSFYISTGAAGGLTNSNDTAAASGFCGGIDSNAASLTFNVQGPFATRRTQINFANADNSYWRIGNYYLGDATSYVSMKLLPNVGTITGGTVTVYGYRKA